MRRVLIDSSYWIALRDKRDPRMGTALRIAHWLVEVRAALVVTPFIFAETQAYYSRVPIIRQLIIRDFWNNPLVTFEQPSFQDQEQAVEILKQHDDKSYSFADTVSFVVMQRLRVKEVVSFDRHFVQFGGFTVIDGKSL